MDVTEYKFDVAFSFLAQDEALAIEINDLLQERVKTFLYSKKQGEIAGTDGEKRFNEVFGEQSRLVVVLYRNGWGKTPWTRIEEIAIRNRGYENGYDFAIFVPLDDPPTVPKWLPRTQLWVGLKRWGITGAASVIEARIEELGGEPHEESVEERAVRLERAIKFEERRNKFLNSTEGVDRSKKEFEALTAELERFVSSIGSAATSIVLSIKKAENQTLIMGFRNGLGVYWKYRWASSLDKSYLEISLWEGHPPFPGIMYFDEPRKLQSLRLNFDLLPSGDVYWVSSSSGGISYPTKDLASFILKFYMDNGNIK